MKINVRIEDSVYEVEIGDINARPVLARIGDETYEVWAGEAAPEGGSPGARSLTALTACPQPATGEGMARGNAVLAPLPGVLIQVTVKAGDLVRHGQELCVIEAMKMKNAIRATRDGKIRIVLVATGDHVNHGQPLMEFAD